MILAGAIGGISGENNNVIIIIIIIIIIMQF